MRTLTLQLPGWPSLSEAFSPSDIRRTVNTTTVCTSTAFSSHFLSIVRIFDFVVICEFFYFEPKLRSSPHLSVQNAVKTRRNALFTEQRDDKLASLRVCLVTCAIHVNLSLILLDDLERITVTVCVEINKVEVEFVIFYLPTFSSREDK